jgi:hypothetical protein
MWGYCQLSRGVAPLTYLHGRRRTQLGEYLDVVTPMAWGPNGVGGWCMRVAAFDFSTAQVRLVASVPGPDSGRHKGADMHNWGHLKLRRVLEAETFDVSPTRLTRCATRAGGS